MSSLQLIPATGPPIEIRSDQQAVILGRSVASDVVLDDGSISRRHARVERRGDACWVVDLGSANGTFRNGSRVKETEIKDGDELRLGSCKLQVRIVADAGDTEATIMVDIDEVTSEMPPVPRNEDPTSSMPAIPAAAPPPAQSPPPPRRQAESIEDLVDATVADAAEDVPIPPPPPRPPRSTPPPRSAPPPPPSSGPSTPQKGAAPVPQMAPPPEKKGRHPAFWVGIGCGGCLLSVVLVAALVGGAAWFFTQGAAEGVERHLEALRAGDPDGAYALLSESYRAQLSEEQFAELLAAHPALADNADVTLSSRSIQNDTARMAGSLTSSSGGVEPVVFELVREQGEWRISAIRFETPE